MKDKKITSEILNILNNFGQSEGIEKLRKLSEESKCSFIQIFENFGANCLIQEGKFEFQLYLDLLTTSEKYDLLISTIRNDNWSYIMEDALGDGEFFDYTNKKIKDQSPLCQKILSACVTKEHAFFRRLPFCFNLKRLLFNNSEKIPQTLEYLLQAFIELEVYDMVIQLGEYFPKKRILGILTSHGDPVLIDKFFSLYKEYPEIKNLTAFI